MTHQQESFHPFSSKQSLSYCLSHVAKRSTIKLHGPHFCQSRVVSKSPWLARNQCTCQHSRILLGLLGCHSKSGQVWPCGVEPIISKLSCRHSKQGELSPNYILGWSHSHPPDSKHGHSYLTYLWNQLKVINMLNDLSRGYLQNCCYLKQLWMALLHVSYPPAQSGGGEDILYTYIFFSNISWTPWVLGPITNPYLGVPPLTAPCYMLTVFFKIL